MATSSIPVFICDRCGTREEIRQSGRTYSWGKIIFSEANGPKWVGSNKAHAQLFEEGKDICPKCVDEVFTWWSTRP